MNFPDPYANKISVRRLRAVFAVFLFSLLLIALLVLKKSYDYKSEAMASTNSMQSAEALLPSTQPRKTALPVDEKQKAYLADLKATAVKLSVDWGARIASVESVMTADLSLNSLRVDAQKGELELKGEASSNAKLTAMVNSMQRAGLDARVGRLARFSNGVGSGSGSGLEYSILIVWPQ